MSEEIKPVIASCSNIVLTHDLQNPYPLLSKRPHEGNVNCVVWNHNNLVLASCGNDGKIVLSNSRKQGNLIQFDDDIQNSSPLTSIQFTSASTKLASGGSNGRVKIYDLKNQCIAKTYSNHFGGVTCVDWHQNDYILASSSQVGDIFLYNTENDQQVATFSENNSVQQIKFSPQRNNYLASCCGDGRVSFWDVNTKQQIAVFQNHQSKVNSVTFSPHNRVLATSASLDATINLYDINEKKVVKKLSCDSPITSLAFHSDGYTLIAGTLYGELMVYDLKNLPKPKLLLEGHTKNQAVNYISIIKNNESRSQVNSSAPNSQQAPNNKTSSLKDISQTKYPQNLSQASNQEQSIQGTKLNDTISSQKSKTSETSSINPSKFNQNNNYGNYSDRDIQQKQINNNNNNYNMTSPSINNSNGKQFSNNQFAQPLNQNTSIKESGIQQQSPAPISKQSQISNSNTLANNTNLQNIQSGKSSQIIQNNYDNQNISTINSQLARKSSANYQEEDNKGQNGLSKNYSSKHIYNQNSMILSSTKQSTLLQQNQLSSSKLQSPGQEDYSEMKRSGITNVQPYELPPKASTIIERTNGKNLSQLQQQPSLPTQQGDDFTSKQKQYIKNMMEDYFLDMKFSFSEQFQNLHIEIIRQFQIQQNELTALLEQYVNKNKALEEKMQQLQLENDRLKKSTY
ncbi:cytochrome d1 heme domain protein (macronuclear) [Tetrahymena thermophila SB210]|uniref:Cytochrome d1 heme domain protein n=1 Tax=Tetrahymena thermophila (strain SB210) TaxID=312017 RepID=I7M3Y6_TETTS|nr:cytochrome d1 heme domain protein [Tetrahymena thermophila SB210]EAS04549.1 cytochrome d1 heme domain protein [Tetrahymena thermophila SB210]|eukprot:XP_001024794.1 cytochrome d1 heme domain protein [Tetrahymena thermophila SB210]